MDWYDNIEPEVRDLVKYLRNNGINTECSCGHEKYIQCQHVIDGNIKELHNLLYCYFCGNGDSCPEYEIEVRVQVIRGNVYSSLDIKLPKEKREERIEVYLRLWKGVFEVVGKEPPDFKNDGWIKLEMEKIPGSLKLNGAMWDREAVKEKLEEEKEE